MKYIIQMGIITGISFIAEVLYAVLPLPVPASVYGLLLLLLFLFTGIVKEEQIRETADFLISIMPLFFVPPSVALLTSMDLLKGNIIKLFVMCLVSTIVVMAVTGGVAQAVAGRGRKKNRTVMGERRTQDE